MGLFKYLSQNWKEQEIPVELKKQRLMAWRRENVTTRIDHPTRLDRARALGYRAKQGIFMVRQRVGRRTHKRPDVSGGRRSRNAGSKINLRKTYKLIAEERANKSYKNCEVLNSYYLMEDGKNYWFEVIMVDRAHPSVLADKRTSWIGSHQGRVYRGVTSAGRKMRGLRHKGRGVEKARPSRRANLRRL